MPYDIEMDAPPEPLSRNAPTFLVGRNRAGQWIALQAQGLAGGIFASREAALHYASTETDRQPGAIEITDAPLDLRL